MDSNLRPHRCERCAAGAPAVYQNAPTFAYAIGEYRVDKEGTLTGPANEALITALQVRGFIAE